MGSWVLWVVAAVILAVGEILTVSFFLGPFALGALGAALAAGFGMGALFATGAFLVLSLAALLIVRPIARSHRRLPPELRTGAAALVGRRATVLERIANHEGMGCVRIDGEVWTARAYDEDEVYHPGARVQVIEIRGATAVVSD